MEYINELPMQLQLLCMQRQLEQGNKANNTLHIMQTAKEGNFDWDATPEGASFWLAVKKLNIDNYKNL